MILETEEYKKDKCGTERKTVKKCTVLLDGEVYCRCYEKDLSDVGLNSGEEAEKEKLERLSRDVLLPRAKRRALFLLNKRRYTRQEMVNKLKEDGYPVTVVDDVLFYLEELHYVDDVSYAKGYASFLLLKCSEREAFQKMIQKGFEKETVSEALENARTEYYFENGSAEEETEPPEHLAIRTYLRKKGYQPEEISPEKKRKMAMSLYRKGFSYSDINAVMGEWETDTPCD